ncbi:hypothetical protein CPELA_05995 [Corynebacterium pelargi]|uniref:Uncharacterized protein n=1 Tax=Corynebacterium pelargi TaxID=1471400 RepID=A0A410W942_9CORY|nr:hypothetical protein CPELA_05995 [Corynebacterium pelargi]
MAILDEDKQPHTPTTPALPITTNRKRQHQKTGTTNTTAVINSTKIKKYWHTIEFSNNTHTHNQASATETQPNTATNTASTQHEQPSTPRASNHHNTNRVAATPINLHTPQPTHKPPAQTHKSRGRDGKGARTTRRFLLQRSSSYLYAARARSRARDPLEMQPSLRIRCAGCSRRHHPP